ncbi:CDP-alcohol phosphatidyltransferase family protein [Acuticoccus sp. M5D2P5]|uniref:CDP-alcohol phosphatidyltransferase family protein n=1 Tax=Acuticoccus kalidii TaxID=2910977 RepID=UPI001F22062E|nr:CDP-alcohol phosphatidyltransferase family protein [Acuticoccus kalidii]MCF3935881.1 CDP-alcohol phosphatidyltransferase family protein [Acuticoccus kalidii]
MTTDNRRPIPSRTSGWAVALARRVAHAGISADQVSAASLVFAVGTALALLAAPGWPPLYLLAALLCPLRLLANLIDGMVAVEHGKASALGPLFNEVPDRIADIVILAAAGVSAARAAQEGWIADWGATAGWLAAIAALLTAYVRELGRALGAPADFSGPFAKQQRMAAITVAAILAAFEGVWGGRGEILFAATLLVAIGAGATAWRRLARLAAFLRAGA